MNLSEAISLLKKNHYIVESQHTTVIAKNKEHLKQLIKDTIDKEGPNCDLNWIDVSNVTNMAGMFYDSDFNGDISKWNVSNVTDMENMFAWSSFNGDISNWDVSNVTNMPRMFYKSVFNGDISNWNVSNVTDMENMFKLTDFKGDISKWNFNSKIDPTKIGCTFEFTNDDLSDIEDDEV